MNEQARSERSPRAKAPGGPRYGGAQERSSTKDPAITHGKGWNLQTGPLRMIKDYLSPFVYEGEASDLHFPINRAPDRLHPGVHSDDTPWVSLFVLPRILVCPWIGNGRNLWLARIVPLGGSASPHVDYAVYRQWGPEGINLRVFAR